VAAGILIQINRSNGGLPKRGIVGPAMLTETSIEGDRCRNRMVHGGPRKAVLILAAEVIDALTARGYPVFYGALGENLTVSGLDPHRWRMGRRSRRKSSTRNARRKMPLRRFGGTAGSTPASSGPV
jgi:MOSC domain-containing protein YiiM